MNASSPIAEKTATPRATTVESAHACAAWAEIDLDALGRNFERLKAMSGTGRQIIVPVKANAYGHGASRIADYLAGRGAYAVQTASVKEAIAIRESGNRVKIIAYPCDLATDLAALLQHAITPTVVDLQGAHQVSAAATKPTAIYVKIDAGLRRLGVVLEEAAEVVAAMAALPHVTVEGIYTHVPFAARGDAEWAESRIRAFESLVHELRRKGLHPHVTQARASAHVLASISDDLSAVCVGHFLYGLRSFAAESASAAPSEPVLRAMRARLIQVRDAPRNPPIIANDPYGGDFRGVGRTGVLPVGRANGIRRPAGNGAAYVLLGGRAARILSVTLEYTVIDLTRHRDAATGDTVTLLGEDGGAVLRIEDVAQNSDCSPLDWCIGLRDIPLSYRSDA